MNDKITSAIKKHQMIPKNIYDRPMTSAHEIGWYSRPLVNINYLIQLTYKINQMDNRRWAKNRAITPITKYVSDYEMLTHKNPFKIPVSNFKMK